MKICLVTTSYPSTGQCHGAQQHTYYLAHQLQKSGHQVDVIAQSKEEKTINDNGVTVHFIQKSWPKFFEFIQKKLSISYFGALDFASFSQSISKKLNQLLQEKRFDLIEMPEGGGLGYAFLSQGKRNIPKIVLKVHSPLFYQQQFNNHPLEFPFESLKQLNNKITKYLEIYCLKKADQIIAPSKAIAEVINQEVPNQPIKIIPHSIDTKTFYPPSSTEKQDDSKFKVLTVTTISKLKGLDLLVETAIKTIQENPNIIFHIIGKDTVIGAQNESYLSHLTEKYQLDKYKNQIVFEGYVPHDQILQHYHQADLFFLPSRTESFGLVLLESMACGVTPIAFDVDAISEIIEHDKTGMIIPALDTSLAAKTILELEKNTEKRKLLSASAQTTAQQYSLHKNINQTIEAYTETLST